MKLHLPKGLRSAVLACMAVVGGFATTVGTGIVAGGALTFALAAVPQAQAAYTTYTMSDLVGAAGTVSEGVIDHSSEYSDSLPVYAMPDGINDAIYGIVDAELSSAIRSNTGYVTVAAWVNPDALNGNQTVFSYGAQSNGFKLCITGDGTLKVTTKGSVDADNGTVTINPAGSWTLVGVVLDLGADTASYIVGDQIAAGVACGNMKFPGEADAANSFGIGIRNSDGTADGEGYQGLIANLKVFYSTDGAITLSELQTEMGGVPKLASALEYSGTEDFVWSSTSTFDGGKLFTAGADVYLSSTSATVKLGENIEAGAVDIGSGVSLEVGEYQLKAQSINVGGELVLNCGEKTLTDVLGGAANVAGSGTVIISGSETKLSGIGDKLKNVDLIVTDGAVLNVDDAWYNRDGATLTIQEGASIVRTTNVYDTKDDGGFILYNNTQNINILSEGVLDLTDTRMCVDASDKICLDSGHISGTGQTEYGLLDFHNDGAVVVSDGTSTIGGPVRLRTKNYTTEFKVQTGTLTIASTFADGNLKKTGAGVLEVGEMSHAGTTQVAEGTLKIGSIGTNIQLQTGATLQMDAGDTLTGKNLLGGTVMAAGSVNLTGLVELEDSVVFDLSSWNGGEEYQIFTLGDGGVVVSREVSLKDMTGNWIMDSTGAIVQKSELHWLGGNLTWNADTVFEGGKMSSSAVIVFDGGAGDVLATVENELAVSILNVESGTNLILGGTGKASISTIHLSGTLTLAGATTEVVKMYAEEGSALVLDAGAEKQWQVSDLPQTDSNAVLTDISIASGSLYLTSYSQTVGDITVEDGAGLRIGGSSTTGKITLNGDGGWVSEGVEIKAALLKNSGDEVSLNNSLDIATDSTVQVDTGTLVISGEVTGETLTKTGSATLNLRGDVTNKALVIDGGTVLWSGSGSENGTNALACDSVTINAGGVFQINHAVVDCSSVDIVLNGGKLYSQDQNVNDGMHFDALKVTADSVVEYRWNGGLVFNQLTGSANLSIQDEGDYRDSGITIIETVKNYNGTLTYTAARGLVMSTFDQGENQSMTIAGAVTLRDFSKTGKGSLNITGASTLEGIVNMNYEGTLAFTGGLNVAAGAVLTYTGKENTIQISALTESVAIDIFGVDISGGVDLNLGIASTVSKDLIAVGGLKNYELEDDNGYWKLVSDDTSLQTDWDFNWGSAGLAGEPASLAKLALAANTSLVDNTTCTTNGKVAANLIKNDLTKADIGTNVDDPNHMICGGKFFGKSGAGADVVADVWLRADGGAYSAIVGASMTGNYSGNPKASSFTGNTHILIDDREADAENGLVAGDLYVVSVVGANFGDPGAGNTATFTGKTFISVYSDSVGGGIVGASTIFHAGNSVFNGDSNVFVYAPLTSDDKKFRNEGDLLVGGALACSGNFTFNGSSNLTLDMSAYDGEATSFEKKIVAGMAVTAFSSHSPTMNQVGGKSTLSIKGTTAENKAITFADIVVGGTYFSTPGTSTTGDTSVSITGGKFTSEVVGGSYQSNGGTSTTGDISLAITGGEFTGNLVGGTLQTNGTSKAGNITLGIAGGSFSNVYGGAYHVNAGTSEAGNVAITVSDGSMTSLVAGSYLKTQGGNLTVADTSIVISGKDVSVSELVVGGHFIDGTGATAMSAALGNSTVTLTSGEVKNIYGGTYSERNNNGSVITQGNVVVDLQGGTVTGNVYAGGYQSRDTRLETESTLVKIGSAVEIASGNTISAGYETTKTNSTISGDQVILFTGDVDQDRSNLTLKDFNKIGVETAGKTVSIGSVTSSEAVTIIGSGIIKLAADANTYSGGLTVAKGATLATNGKSITGDLTIEDGATISGVASATNIAVGTFVNTQGMTATGEISVGTELTSSAALTAGKITGEGNVEITGGVVTLSDSTDAFDNAGTTNIAGAELAGAWAAEDVTLGEGITVTGTVSLKDATINATLTNNDTLNLSGTVVLGSGITQQNVTDTYSEGDNGYRTTSGDYIVSTGTGTYDVTDVTWNVGGSDIAADKASFAAGTLTVEGAEGTVYYVRSGDVTDTETSGATGIILAAKESSTAQLILSSTPGVGISVQGTGNTIQLGGAVTLTTGTDSKLTLESGAAVALTGSGTYDLGSGTTLSTGVSLGTDWVGTVKTTATLANTAATSDLCLAGSTLELSGVNFADSLDTFEVAGALTLGSLTIADTILPTEIGSVTLVSAESVTNGAIGSIGTEGFVVSDAGGIGAQWFAKNIGGYSYTIEVKDGAITLTTGMAGNAWQPSQDDMVWEQGEADNWPSGEPGTGGETALFNGLGVDAATGVGEVVVNGTVTPDGIVISAQDKTYNFVGDSADSGAIASTGTLNILAGEAAFDNIQAAFKDTETDASSVGAGTALQVGDGDVDNGQGIVSFETLNVAEDATVTVAEDGILSAENVNNEGSILVQGGDDKAYMEVTDTLSTAGTVELADGGILYAAALEIQDGGEVQLNGGELRVDSLDVDTYDGINRSAGTLSVSGEFSGDLDEMTLSEGSTGSLAFEMGSYTDASFGGTDDSEAGLVVKEGVNLTVTESFKTGALTVEEGATAAFQAASEIKSMAAGSKVTLGKMPSTTSYIPLRLIPGEPSYVENYYYSGSTVAGYNAENIMEVTITPEAGATMSFDATNAIVKLGTSVLKETIELTDASGMTDSVLAFTLDTGNIGATVFSGEKLTLTDSEVSLTVSGGNVLQKVDTTIAVLNATEDSVATVTPESEVLNKYYTNIRLEGGNVVADINTSYAESKIETTSENGKTGTALLSDALVSINPQATKPDGDLAMLLDAVDSAIMTDKDAAAVAGASIATMGMALNSDVERQLRAIRNRTTSMGVNECVVNEGMPYFNAWVNAEGNRAELDKDGTNAGYQMDSWGGTVGFDVDLTPNFTMGMALTAMYGDITANGPETKAEGDMDTYYVSLFARYASCAWTHTFVATVGMMDGSMDRTVNIGGHSYTAEGTTDGMTFGLMYEVGYVVPLDEDATACLQPVFNVMLRHSSIGSYTEEGTDAALDVDSQTMTTLTFGLGARMQAVVGESLYNRASIFEARALAKVDLGDRQSKTDVGFVGGRRTAEIQSAELGAFGVELGAGLTIPLGDDDGSIFVDGSAEIRSGYTNLNATVGYRINF